MPLTGLSFVATAIQHGSADRVGFGSKSRTHCWPLDMNVSRPFLVRLIDEEIPSRRRWHAAVDTLSGLDGLQTADGRRPSWCTDCHRPEASAAAIPRWTIARHESSVENPHRELRRPQPWALGIGPTDLIDDGGYCGSCSCTGRVPLQSGKAGQPQKSPLADRRLRMGLPHCGQSARALWSGCGPEAFGGEPFTEAAGFLEGLALRLDLALEHVQARAR